MSEFLIAHRDGEMVDFCLRREIMKNSPMYSNNNLRLWLRQITETSRFIETSHGALPTAVQTANTPSTNESNDGKQPVPFLL